MGKVSGRKQYRDLAAKTASNGWDTTRLIEWVRDLNRKPAVTSFTEGPARQVAYAIENALRLERETAPSIPHLTLRPTEQCPRCAFVQVLPIGGRDHE